MSNLNTDKFPYTFEQARVSKYLNRSLCYETRLTKGVGDTYCIMHYVTPILTFSEQVLMVNYNVKSISTRARINAVLKQHGMMLYTRYDRQFLVTSFEDMRRLEVPDVFYIVFDETWDTVQRINARAMILGESTLVSLWSL